MVISIPTQPLIWACFLVTTLLDCQISSALPVFGTKRYGRSVGVPTHRIPPWAPLPLQAYPPPPPSTVNQYLPPSYYPDYPYASDYDTDYFYTPDPIFNAYPPVPPLPMYSALEANDNLKYAIYRAMQPYYYDTRRAGYGYYGFDDKSDPVDNVHEEMMQDEEREERGDALPIGQETWFENESAGSQQPQSQDNLADVNAAFLKNLIISQMYNDAQNRESALRQQQLRQAGYGMENSDDWIYGDPRRNEYYSESDDEDEDVRELKSLVKRSDAGEDDRYSNIPSRQNDKLVTGGNDEDNVGVPVLYPSFDRSFKKRNSYFENIIGEQLSKENSEPWVPMNDEPISFTDRKGNRFSDNQRNVDEVVGLDSVNPENPVGTTTTQLPTTAAVTEPTTEAPDFDPRRGQKEVPLLRPAQPPHRPVFEDAIDFLLYSQQDRPRGKPSVFDTIKQLLNMEEGLREGDGIMKQQPRKRFVPNEESLAEQLGGLKKNAV